MGPKARVVEGPKRRTDGRCGRETLCCFVGVRGDPRTEFVKEGKILGPRESTESQADDPFRKEGESERFEVKRRVRVESVGSRHFRPRGLRGPVLSREETRDVWNGVEVVTRKGSGTRPFPGQIHRRYRYIHNQYSVSRNLVVCLISRRLVQSSRVRSARNYFLVDVSYKSKDLFPDLVFLHLDPR